MLMRRVDSGNGHTWSRVRAVVHDRYGPPEVLHLEDVEQTVPKNDEVLIRIHATTVNRSDCALRAAEPFFSRFLTGIRRPRQRILGAVPRRR